MHSIAKVVFHVYSDSNQSLLYLMRMKTNTTTLAAILQNAFTKYCACSPILTN